MDIPDLLQRQRTFYQSGKTKEPGWRKRQLQTLRTVITGNQEQFVSALKNDLAKPEFETLSAEILMVIQDIDFHLRHLERWSRPASVRGNLFTFPSEQEVRRAPFGLCLIIGSWNYPLNLILQPLVGAVSGGNCIVLKPSELAPATSRILSESISSAFPDEYIAVAEGGVSTAQSLLAEPFDKIFFTGSSKTGQKVMEQAARNCTPLTLELGGKCPAIVHKDADPERAARRILWGKCLNAGQTCIAPDFLLIHESIRDTFIRHAESAIHDFFGEDPALSPDYARIVNPDHFNRICSLMEGTERLTGGEIDAEQLYIAPALVSPPGWDHPIMKEEIFGPVLPVIPYRKIDELHPKLDGLPSPLSLYLFSESKEWIKQTEMRIECGSCCINDLMLNFSNLRLPFGGTGGSGFGVYHGKHSFDTFTRPYGVMNRKKWPDFSFRYPPYSRKLRLLKRFLLR